MEAPQYEQQIDERYLSPSTASHSYRAENFRSAGIVPWDHGQELRFYFGYKGKYAADDLRPGVTNLKIIGEEAFLQKATAITKKPYQVIIQDAVGQTGPVMEMFTIGGLREKRPMVTFRPGIAMGMNSALSKFYLSLA